MESSIVSKVRFAEFMATIQVLPPPARHATGNVPFAGGTHSVIPVGARNSTFASLAGSMHRRGFSQTAIAAALRSENQARCDPPMEDEEVDGIVASICRYPAGSASGSHYTATGQVSDSPAVAYANFADLEVNPPPPREWVVPDWFPLCSVVALFSLGGLGKTLFAQQLATHVAAGLDIFGQHVMRGPVLGFLCEDDNDELRRRQAKINAVLKLDDTPAGLFLEGRVGKNNTLFTFESQHFPSPTALLHLIDAECAEKKPVLLIIDNIAQVYAGMEIDRHQVTVFCNELAGLAQKHRCCILLLGHTAKAEGSEWSGSTAWEAAVRTRLWLKRCDNDLLELHRKKANYSGLDCVTLQWQDGYLHTMRCGVGGAFAVNEATRAVVAHALREFTKAKISTSNSPQARNYLPKLMREEGKLNDISFQSAKNALSAMVADETIISGRELGWKTASRHPATGLVLAATQPAPTPSDAS
ncbi:MAG: AAA family ATPase [Sulfuritalea sp.]|nr:AAA family ATPase [Sulfuritalea sp.]